MKGVFSNSILDVALVPSWIFHESDNVVWFSLGYSMNQRTQRQPTSHQPASYQVPTRFVKLWVLATLFLGGDKRLEEGLKQNIYISVNPIFFRTLVSDFMFSGKI